VREISSLVVQIWSKDKVFEREQRRIGFRVRYESVYELRRKI
jgi:hypothetical protein